MNATEILQDWMDMHKMILDFLPPEIAQRIRKVMLEGQSVITNEDQRGAINIIRKLLKIPVELGGV